MLRHQAKAPTLPQTRSRTLRPAGLRRRSGVISVRGFGALVFAANLAAGSWPHRTLLFSAAAAQQGAIKAPPGADTAPDLAPTLRDAERRQITTMSCELIGIR